MANIFPRRVVQTDRDQEILAAVDRCPLTAEQLLKLSGTFGCDAFPSIRTVQMRVQKLKEAGWVRSWPYATTSRGSPPEYYRLSPEGFRLLHGPDFPVPSKRHFSEIAVGHHHHTQSLADVIVHLYVAADQQGIRVRSFSRENSFKLEVAGDAIWPDGSIEVERPDGERFRFLLELDNSTKSLQTTASFLQASNDRDADTIERTARVYHGVQDAILPTRFRVLYVTTRSSDRFRNILSVAAAVSPDSRRTLFYGVDLASLLATPNPLDRPCFYDHRGHRLPLLPAAEPKPPPRTSRAKSLARPVAV